MYSATKSANYSVVSFSLGKDITTNHATFIVFVYTVKLLLALSLLFFIFTTRFMDSVVDIQCPDNPLML